MAHGEPDRNRTDIRSDRRPIPQKHHSARGDAPRNSGNFTRGSQLLNTQVLMWTQGARIPIYMWLGVFVLAYLSILSVTLDENNIQLICMRVLRPSGIGSRRTISSRSICGCQMAVCTEQSWDTSPTFQTWQRPGPRPSEAWSGPV